VRIAILKERRLPLKALGRHLLTEFYGCDRDILNDVDQVKKGMEEAALRSGATIIDAVFHLFNPHGVSGVVVIAESHLAIHTWPEYGYAAVDLFTCGEEVDPYRAYEFLKEKLRAQFTSLIELRRGELDIEGEKVRHKPLSPSLSPPCRLPIGRQGRQDSSF